MKTRSSFPVPRELAESCFPLVFFDIESTGVDVAKDRIVQLAVVRFQKGEAITREWWINPGVPIPAEVTEIHGIRDEDVANSPRFEDVADEVAKLFEGAGVAGYNILGFDVPMLAAEFIRSNRPVPFKHGMPMMDACGIFKRQEPRTLEGAVRFYCGREMREGAHNALVDVQETVEVFVGQLQEYALDLRSSARVAEVEELSKPENAFDLTGKIIKTDKGEAFNFGKHKGRLVKDVAKTDKGYIRWLLKENVIPDEAGYLRAMIGLAG